ncbi:MAG: diguanylate cyclase [Magnetococcales bacterium]|nr:diguanylate cyclase [Magnetococcales bacterium]
MNAADERARILIVDDVPGNIKALAVILREEFQVRMATNGKDALRLISQEKIDLVLLDVTMPEMDGFEVCATLKAQHETAGICVLFVTGLNEEADQTKGLALGASDYITKPLSPPILLARVRNHVAAKRQRDQLEQLSLNDTLTNIANRRYFDQFLQREWNRSVRGGSPLSLILMDIDYFKTYNDSLGHAAGDDCLRRVAHSLQDTMHRSTDLLARYGGEEFVAVLPHVEHVGATAMAEKFRQTVVSLHIPHPLSQIADHVTLSLGCASMLPIRSASPQLLLESADKMLYAAKEGGRNRVMSIFH